METRNLTDRIWLVVVALLALLLVAGAVRVLAAPADETFDAAREALNKARYQEAEELYRQVYERERQGKLAADALYWRAFAFYKLGRERHLQQALELLELQRHEFPGTGEEHEAQELYTRVMGALARHGDAHAARRVHELAHRERETKMAALQALMMMDEEKALPLLERILSDPDAEDPELKRHALMVLTQVDDERAEKILLEVVARETDPEMLAQSMFWLARIGSDAAFDAVIETYRRSDHPEVKQAALMAMGESDDRRAGDLLIEIASDTSLDTDVRTQAIWALAQGDHAGLADYLASLYLQADDPEFKTMIMFSMSQLDDPAPSAWFVDIITDRGEDIEVRQQALHQASVMDLIDVDFLRTIYAADDDPEMRTQICFALSQLDDPDAVDLAIEIVRNETHPEVRQNAVFWLGQFDDPRVADFLVELIEED